MKRVSLTAVLVTTLYLLSGCGGGSSGKKAQIAKCAGDYQDALQAKAAEIPKGLLIEKTSKDARLRIWHFPNGKKVVCLMQGKAKLISAKN